MFKMIVNGVYVDMFVGICDFEYKQKQKVIVNVTAYGKPKFIPENINDCLDYSKVCSFVHSWSERKHVDLVETLLVETIDFCFKDKRILEVDIEILKPDVIENTNFVGVGARINRSQFEKKEY